MPKIQNDSVFANGYGLIIDNSPYLVRERLSIKPQIGDRWHTVVEGDRLELLAFRYYKNFIQDAQNWWWLLADANNIANPFSIDAYVGRFFLIPEFFRMQRFISDSSNDALPIKNFGDSIKAYEQDYGYSINEIYPLSGIGSGGSGEILPDFGTPVSTVTPVGTTDCTPKKIHLFFELQNGGGYKIANFDSDGHIQYYPANPNDYCNSLIVEAPTNIPNLFTSITPLEINDDFVITVNDEGETNSIQ